MQISDTVEFTKIIRQVKQLPGGSGGLDLPLNPGRYYWRIASAVADGRLGPDSAPQSFEVQPSATATSSPDSAIKTTLRWRAGKPGQKVQFQVSLDAGFNAPLIDVTQEEPLAAFESRARGPYYARLRRIDPDGTSSQFEATQQFTLQPIQ